MCIMIRKPSIGVIPGSKEDPRVLTEQMRELKEGFPSCKCSNCDSEAADYLVHNLPRLCKGNYKQAMKDLFNVEGFTYPKEKEGTKVSADDGKGSGSKSVKKKRGALLDPALEELADELVYIFDLHYQDIFGEDDYCESTDYFGLDEAKGIVQSLDNITCASDVKKLMGGDLLVGGVDTVFNYISDWKTRDIGMEYKHRRKQITLEMIAEEEIQSSKELNKTSNQPDRVIVPTPGISRQKKTRRTSAQVLADNKAATLKKEYNKRCLKWLKDKVPENQLDEMELAYQNSIQEASGSVQGDHEKSLLEAS
ncbi:uncharacterized protein MELLADRAFT_113255 [Melampsora larici-populina 98AG31]|uniref:Uncharacterized protein n=1 Tax=Melampsora larici-populina (strain 98AG31 / pathotype 3-4-7) TaxID=747676 RepID=F4S995_MELLP|nr:uncharacterized protein MELLADRAFT_113255 [Melampsora larici-populina 98AG31]EGF98781.1 hypothetical protein MELLADRAFT_113255 [Melampsora larici-populina 98AG31]